LAGIGYGNGAYGSCPDPELLPAVEVPDGEDPEEDMVIVAMVVLVSSGSD